MIEQKTTLLCVSVAGLGCCLGYNSMISFEEWLVRVANSNL